MATTARRIFLAAIVAIGLCLAFCLQALAATAEVQSNGVRIQVPETSLMYEHTSDQMEMWVARYDGGCTLRIVTDRLDWNGDEDTVLAYADFQAQKAQKLYPDAHIAAADWAESENGVLYASAGAAWQDGIMLVAVVPCDSARVAVVSATISGTVTGEAKADAATLLNGIALAPVAYGDVIGLLALEPARIPATLEEQGLSYLQAADGHGGDWAGLVQDAFYGSDIVQVMFVRLGDGSTAWPQLGREELLAGVPVSGAEVEWLGADVPWDEPLDVLDALTRAYGLTDAYETGYVTDLEEDESYMWAAIGEFKLGGKDAYWLVSVIMDGEGGGSILLSADLLQNGYTSSTYCIQDIARDLFL